MDDLGAPGSYLTLEEGVPVLSREGERLGRVEHVLADADVDVFDGLVIGGEGRLPGHRFVDARQVAEIHERGVVTSVAAADAPRLPEPSENPPALDVDPDDTAEGELQRKLRDAWDRISGRY
jgi:uncharacterized protein YrrD